MPTLDPQPLATRSIPKGAHVLIPLVGLAMLFPLVSSGVALAAGITVALTVGNPWPAQARLLAHKALTWSVVGLGAGMNLTVVGRVGLQGLGYTIVGISGAMMLGAFLGRRLGVSRDVSLLITVGTAICGGSAIAAVAPTIRAKHHDVSMALVTVFMLNSIALFIFPVIGRHLQLGQHAFGLWCALAIHDTSSVVGAAAQYGERALEIATVTKLARALWIVPVTFAVALLRAREGQSDVSASDKPSRPWFIAGFIVMATIVTYAPQLRVFGHFVSAAAHRLLAVTLFLMGLGLSRPALRALGFRPVVQGVALWFALGSATLALIMYGWIK